MTSHKPEMTEEAVAALRRQEEKAFEVFFNSHSGLVYSIAWAALNNRQKAEDALQEVFLKAWHALPRFEGNKLAAWLSRITHNVCVDIQRQQQRSPAIAGKPVEEIAIVQDHQISNEFPAMLDTLKPLEKEVIILKKIEGLSYQEISEITGSLRNMVMKVIKSLQGASNEQGM